MSDDQRTLNALTEALNAAGLAARAQPQGGGWEAHCPFCARSPDPPRGRTVSYRLGDKAILVYCVVCRRSGNQLLGGAGTSLRAIRVASGRSPAPALAPPRPDPRQPASRTARRSPALLGPAGTGWNPARDGERLLADVSTLLWAEGPLTAGEIATRLRDDGAYARARYGPPVDGAWVGWALARSGIKSRRIRRSQKAVRCYVPDDI